MKITHKNKSLGAWWLFGGGVLSLRSKAKDRPPERVRLVFARKPRVVTDAPVRYVTLSWSNILGHWNAEVQWTSLPTILALGHTWRAYGRPTFPFDYGFALDLNGNHLAVRDTKDGFRFFYAGVTSELISHAPYHVILPRAVAFAREVSRDAYSIPVAESSGVTRFHILDGL